MSSYDDEDPLVPVEKTASAKLCTLAFTVGSGILVITAIIASCIHAFTGSSGSTAWLPVGVGFLAIAFSTMFLLKMANADVFDEPKIVYSIYAQAIGSIILAGSFVALIFSPAAPALFYVGGQISGTGTATVEITVGKQTATVSISGNDMSTVSGKGFIMPEPLAEGADGSASIKPKAPMLGQPGASCVVRGSGGPVTAVTEPSDNMGINIVCTYGYSVGGKISGVPVGQSVTLTNTATTPQDTMTFTSTSASSFDFVMPKVLTPSCQTQGLPYNVQVTNPATGCTLNLNQNTATGPVSNIQVVCTPPPTPPPSSP